MLHDGLIRAAVAVLTLALGIGAVVVAAAYLPAYQATRVHPLEVLRGD